MSAYRPFVPSKLPMGDYERLSEVVAETTDANLLKKVGRLRMLASVAQTTTSSFEDGGRLAVAASILADLGEQNWSIRRRARYIEISPPSADPEPGETIAAVKQRLRQGLMVASDRQLASPAVREFMRLMERDRAHAGRVVSIKSVLDNGPDLAAELREIAGTPSGPDRLAALASAIQPVVEVCESDAVCRFTGLKLQDIWRYCRHSWALEYNPIPGRTLRFLVRNKARPNWPIMGIAMLASPAANYYVRDHWIGWRLDDVATQIVDGKLDPKRVGKALLDVVRKAIGDIRTDDLCSDSELSDPTEQTFFKLDQIRHLAESGRRTDLIARRAGNGDSPRIDIRDFDKERMSDNDWHLLSGTSLFVKKRSEQLLDLLRCLRFMIDAGFGEAPGAAVCEALVTKPGRYQLSFALAELRRQRLASEIADLSVCGAIEPYNHILGGKLTALLMASAEVQAAYKKRYEGQVSEISSQIAGRAIRRPAGLKVLTTTSLYGVASSQYNRLRLRAGVVPELSRDVRWEELAQTRGVTVTHLSKLTVSYMKRLAISEFGTRRVNSVFGEGSSPRTRQVREGLNLIGMSSDSVLEQGLPRRVYVCEVYAGAKGDLHGFVARSKSRHAQRLSAISRAWLARWVVERVGKEEVLSEIAGTTSDTLPDRLRQRADTAESEIPREIGENDLFDVTLDDLGEPLQQLGDLAV